MTDTIKATNGDSALPTKIEDSDRFELLLVNERQARLKAEAQLIANMLEQVQAEAQRVSARLRNKYKLEDGDSLNSTTGHITRKKGNADVT